MEFIASVSDIYKTDPTAKITKQGTTFSIILYPKK